MSQYIQWITDQEQSILVVPADWQETVTNMFLAFCKNQDLHVANNLEKAKEWLISCANNRVLE